MQPASDSYNLLIINTEKCRFAVVFYYQDEVCKYINVYKHIGCKMEELDMLITSPV